MEERRTRDRRIVGFEFRQEQRDNFFSKVNFYADSYPVFTSPSCHRDGTGSHNDSTTTILVSFQLNLQKRRCKRQRGDWSTF